MKKIIKLGFLFFACSVLIYACAGGSGSDSELSDSLQSKDNPALVADSLALDSLQTGLTIENMIGDSLYAVILNADSVKAFLLDGNVTDTQRGLHNFKIIRSKKLKKNETDSLHTYLADKNNFDLGGYNKKCGFKPEIGYKFYRTNSEIDLLMFMQCDVFKIYCSDTVFVDDFDPSHGKFLNLKNSIFNTNIQ